MSLEKKLRDTGEGALNRFENYQKQLVAERKQRQQFRRQNVQAIDRMMALMIDFFLVIMIFVNTILDQSQKVLQSAAVLARVAEDPSFTMPQAMDVLVQGGLIQAWLALCFTQVIVLAIVVVPSLYFFQATPGMVLLGLRVRQADRKTKATLSQYLRFFFFGCLLLTPAMLSYLGMKIRTDKRAWHDVWGGVTVVRKRMLEDAKKEALLAAIEAEESQGSEDESPANPQR